MQRTAGCAAARRARSVPMRPEPTIARPTLFACTAATRSSSSFGVHREGSIDLYVRVLHDFGPLGDFAFHEFRELFGRAPDRLDRRARQQRLHVGVGRGTHDLGIEAPDYFT